MTALQASRIVPPSPAGAVSSPITRAATFPVQGSRYGDSAIAIKPKAGDLVVLAVMISAYSDDPSTGVTGGNVGTWHEALSYTDTNRPKHFDLWWGVATSTGRSRLSITYSGTVSQKKIELLVDSFTSAVSGWSFVTSGGSSNSISDWATWPTLTSGAAADQLYWGTSEEKSGATSTPTPGFTSDLTAMGNCFLYDGGLAPLTAYSPRCGESPPNISTAVGVIIAVG